MRLLFSAENVLIVAWNSAVSGIMFALVPAWNCPTVITTGSKALKERVISNCSALTISAATGIGSFAV